MMKRSDKIDIAASRFMRRISPGFNRHNLPLYDRRQRETWSLVRAAFASYDTEWNSHDHDIRDWKWPQNELVEATAFQGNEPWSVLFRAAMATIGNAVSVES